MRLKMTTLSRAAAAVLDQLTDGLGVGESRKLDRGAGFMAVSVECLQQTGLGPLFSVAHYFNSNGDLVPDPDVVFVRAADGWSPMYFQDSRSYREAVTIHADGTIEVDENEQRDLVSFCNMWMRNIREQQALPTRKPR
jgi:hypothetical protein